MDKYLTRAMCQAGACALAAGVVSNAPDQAQPVGDLDDPTKLQNLWAWRIQNVFFDALLKQLVDEKNYPTPALSQAQAQAPTGLMQGVLAALPGLTPDTLSKLIQGLVARPASSAPSGPIPNPGDVAAPEAPK